MKLRRIYFINITLFTVFIIGCGSKNISIEEDAKNSKDIEEEYLESTTNDATLIKANDDLTMEVKKLKAELNHYNANLRELRAKSQVWGNPFVIYNKEIILTNGSAVFGKIVYQDRDIIKVETLVGRLIIDRNDIVRVVENIVDESLSSEDKLMESPDQLEIIEVEGNGESGINIIERTREAQTAQIILIGNIEEKKDKAGNTILFGEVKNVGSQRADFAKINLTFRKNWHGDTETLTAFCRGSYYTFKTGITSDSSIMPGAIAEFELIVPKSMGSFIGYSYTLDWEQYE